MNLREYETKNKWIMLLICVVAGIFLIVAVVKNHGGTRENDIQSFEVIFLDEGKEIYSDDVRYCRFLEMYFDSFSFNEVAFEENYKIENLEKNYLVKVVVSCLNDIEYVIFLDINEKDSEIESSLFSPHPTDWVIKKVEGSNIFIIPGQHSSNLVKIFREINES